MCLAKFRDESLESTAVSRGNAVGAGGTFVVRPHSGGGAGGKGCEHNAKSSHSATFEKFTSIELVRRLG